MKRICHRSGTRDPYQVTAWLRKNGAVLELLDNFDLAADKLVAHAFNSGGRWSVLLADTIHTHIPNN